MPSTCLAADAATTRSESSSPGAWSLVAPATTNFPLPVRGRSVPQSQRSRHHQLRPRRGHGLVLHRSRGPPGHICRLRARAPRRSAGGALTWHEQTSRVEPSGRPWTWRHAGAPPRSLWPDHRGGRRVRRPSKCRNDQGHRGGRPDYRHPAGDLIRAGAGDDVVNSRAGGDFVSGGRGDDILRLGVGSDGGSGGTGSGDDTIRGAPVATA